VLNPCRQRRTHHSDFGPNMDTASPSPVPDDVAELEAAMAD
jgi:hypothetical protein